MGWDSQATGGNSIHKAEKVFGKNGQLYVGVAGRARYGNVLSYLDVPAVHPAEYAAEDFDAMAYLVTEVVPAWVEGLEQQFKKIPDQAEDWPDGVGLVVIHGRIFEVGHDFTVTEAMQDFAGVGSGSDYALGALASGKSVEKALEIAVMLDPYTGGDLNIMKGVK